MYERRNGTQPSPFIFTEVSPWRLHRRHTRAVHHFFDRAGALLRCARMDPDDLKSKVAIGLFVHALKAQSIFKADPARLGLRNESKVAHEEDLLLVDSFGPYPLELALEPGSDWHAKKRGQGRGAHS